MSRMHPFAAAFGLLLLSTHALAAGGTGAGAISLQFNTSARAAGMGDTGVATIWGGDTNVWANPAMLAFRPGLRYGTMHSQLAVGLANDIFIDKKELTFGIPGAGLLFADGPIDHVYLDMGEQTGTDEGGNPTGTFSSYMKSQSWGLAVGAADLLHHLKIADIGGWVDVAGGMVWKDYEDKLADDSIIQDAVGGGTASASARDHGWVARVTPLNTLARAADAGEAQFGFLVEASYARAKLNDTDEWIVHVDADQRDPMPIMNVSGWALHGELQAGPRLFESASDRLRDTIMPLVAVTYTQQTIVPGYRWTGTEYIYDRDDSGDFDEENWGWEISLLNMLHLRRGHVEALYGDIDGDTEGWGLSLQAGRYAGFRYDKATVPQAQGLPTVDREGWQFWVDVLAVASKK
ncbi:MAG: hypothetical protein IPH86_12470 [bacterium]|nr:hypothetical protein [bacterium]